MKKLTELTDLTPDPNNFNRGTARGNEMLDRSFSTLGAGRSVLVDRNGVVIAGNKSYEKFGETGGEDIIVVPTDGTKLVVVQRVDLDMQAHDDDRARQMALLDNRTAQVNLDWNPGELLQSGLDLDGVFFPDEIKNMKADEASDVAITDIATAERKDSVATNQCPKCEYKW